MKSFCCSPFYFRNIYPNILDIIQKFSRTLVTKTMYERTSDYEIKLEGIDC